MSQKEPTPEEILNTPLKTNFYSVRTIKDYLLVILAELWKKQEVFNPRRPFGFDGWPECVYKALVFQGYVRGAFDEENTFEVTYVDYEGANDLILKAIKYLGE